MQIVKDFLREYGFTIVYTLLTAIAAFIGSKIKAIYEARCNDDTKKKVVSDCVKAVEQLYSDLCGAEKLEYAKTNIVCILQEKGITISELEMDILIESVVAELNFNDFRINKKESEE